MQNIQSVFNEFSKAISQSKIDFQLYFKLKEQLKNYKVEKQSFEDYVRLIILVYDLSNYQKLYIIKKTEINMNKMAIHLKILVCSMISNVILHYDKQVQDQYILPINLLSHAIEIMIICTRICLNQKNQFISQVNQYYKYIYNAYEYVVEKIDLKIQFYHNLNSFEIMKFKISTESFNILEFQNKLALLFQFQEVQLQQFAQFIQNIILQVLLKALKCGKFSSQDVIKFYPYLMEQNQRIIQSLVENCQKTLLKSQKGSQFIQLFHQIKNHGIQSVSVSYLQEFIEDQKNFNDQRIFEIAGITIQPIILQIWFQKANSKKQKCINLQKALNCFIHVSQSIINDQKSQGQSDLKKQKQKSLLKLTKNVILILLTQKKDNKNKTSDPIFSTIKVLVKNINYFCFHGDQNANQIKDFGQKLCLVCSRYNCMQISKVIYSILTYYFLSKKINCDQIFQKFSAYHHNQKPNQIFNILKLAYQVQKGIISKNSDNFSICQLQKQPFIAILFAQDEQDLLIFQLNQKQFKQIQNKMLIYCSMIKKYIRNQKNLKIIFNHMQNIFIKLTFEDIQSQLTQENHQLLKKLKRILYFIIANNKKQQIQKMQIQQISHYNEISFNFQSLQKSQISFILLNLIILQKQELKRIFSDYNYGILLNKYSKHVKIFNQILNLSNNNKLTLNNEFYNLSCSYLIYSLQKYKRQYLKKQRIGQPGQLIFIHVITDLIKHLINREKQKTSNSKNNKMKKVQINYINFIIFQIDCLTNNTQKYSNQLSEIQIQLLQTFNNSLFIPKQLKHKILRQIIKQSLFSNKNNISLKQLKQIIQITDDQDEIQLYLKCLSTGYGQQGKKLLMLLANKDKRIQKILLNDQQELQI